MYHLLVVAAGGAVGASMRHLLNLASLRLIGPTFPWGTLTINIVGSFAMGVFIELLARRTGASPELRLFVATGVLGGFTTFSAFSLDVVVLWERGAHAAAAGYVAASVAGAVAALIAGMAIVRGFA
ncbi:MAG: fluoride efflux transporter CrcB [Rhizobiaceae bacterium]